MAVDAPSSRIGSCLGPVGRWAAARDRLADRRVERWSKRATVCGRPLLGSNKLPTPRRVSAAWDAVNKFGVATRNFYRGLPPQIETVVQQTHDLSDSAARGTRILTLRTAARSVRLMDPRDGRQLGGANPCGMLADAAWFDLLSWQSTRLEAALVDAPPADVEFLSAAAQTYRTQAAEMAQQPNLPAAAGEPIDFQGPTTLSLTTQPEQNIDVRVRNISDQSAEVWLMLDYDPAKLELEVPERRRCGSNRNGSPSIPKPKTSREMKRRSNRLVRIGPARGPRCNCKLASRKPCD